MKVKKKHIQVIVFSSLIISIVIITTLAAQLFYVQWKKDTSASAYRNSIYDLTARIFRDDLVVRDAGISVKNPQGDQRIPVFEGSIENRTGKTITSILMEVSFLREEGSVAYKGWFRPVGEGMYGSSALLHGGATGKVLLPGEMISFREKLPNCPREIISGFAEGAGAARYDGEEFELSFEIKGMSVI
ncbi:MAG: hypothetical protein GF392_06295 [Candidatus Omnitrophica bacterium]|nr:hypothetical protein [Candidatus Omnitrophota bacterium]